MNKIKELMNATADELDGFIIKHGNKKYLLEKERMPGSCMGCSFYNTACPWPVVSYCFKGLILKEIKK